MHEVYSTGSWKPSPGEEEAFLEAWREFAAWATGLPGAGPMSLGRDVREPGRFVSFGSWESMEALRAWKGSPEFKERMARVQRHVDRFSPTELELVAELDGGGAAV